MTARQLEEFIGVIETAERLAHKENVPSGQSTQSSSLWSYPTDIFTGRRSPSGRGLSVSPSNSPLRVKKLRDKVYPNNNHFRASDHSQVNLNLFFVMLMPFI